MSIEWAEQFKNVQKEIENIIDHRNEPFTEDNWDDGNKQQYVKLSLLPSIIEEDKEWCKLTYKILIESKSQTDGFYWQVFPILTAAQSFIFYISIGSGATDEEYFQLYSRIIVSIIGIAFIVICWASFAINKHRSDIYSMQLLVLEKKLGWPMMHHKNIMVVSDKRCWYKQRSLYDLWIDFFVFLIFCHISIIMEILCHITEHRNICEKWSAVGCFVTYVLYLIFGWAKRVLENESKTLAQKAITAAQTAASALAVATAAAQKVVAPTAKTAAIREAHQAVTAKGAALGVAIKEAQQAVAVLKTALEAATPP